MSLQRKNELGQPIGEPLPDWRGCEPPKQPHLQGTHIALRPLDVGRDAGALLRAYGSDASLWTYLPYGPFTSEADYAHTLGDFVSDEGLVPLVIIDEADTLPLGIACYMRIASAVGSIEIGHICLSPRLQRTRAATEAMMLMLSHVFDDLGYRRCEWKCDALNAASRQAAERLGFCFEGIFRQATIYKGRNRDTAWYSIIDGQWPTLRKILQDWLNPSNFDQRGQQLTRLSRATRKP
jgi:RimJ/RimL family protein N-acetyltransferase